MLSNLLNVSTNLRVVTLSKPVAQRAFRADAFHQVLHLVKLETLGAVYGRDVGLVQAESLVAGLAVEVAMQFVRAAFMVIVAHAILSGTASILDFVDEVVLRENFKRPEDGGLVYRIQFHLQVSQAESVMELQH